MFQQSFLCLKYPWGKTSSPKVLSVHTYLLSTLEDLILSSLLLPQIIYKKQANTKLWRPFYHSCPQKTLMVPDRLLLRSCVYFFKVNGVCVCVCVYVCLSCVLVSIVRENIEILCKKYSFL